MIGAREHYALPRALEAVGALGRLYTDAWAGPLLRGMTFGPAALRSLAARHHAALPRQKVVAFTAGGIRRQMARPAARTLEEQFLRFVEDGRTFALQVNRHLERNWISDRLAGLIGYDTGCLETQQFLAAKGFPSVVDQIDPARTEEEIVHAETTKWPGWQAMPGRIPEVYFRRLEEEWRLASRVVVNSEWSRDALIRQGVPADKLVVIPLCYEATSDPLPQKAGGSDRTITVLWVGQVILRKGIQYLIEAARMLGSRGVQFIIAGPIGISKVGLDSAPPNMSFVGPVSRGQVSALYRSADLFVLPTLSDGFAITQLEAMAHGLPVVTTPSCGQVVSDGADGRIVPAGDAIALAGALDQLISDPGRLGAMSRQARETVKRFSIAQTASCLEELIREMSSVCASTVPTA